MINEENNFLEFSLLNESGMQVTILNYGGTVKNVMVPDRNGEMGDVVLGFDTNEEYEQKENPFFGCITGRFANRIAGGKFSIDGKPYQVAVNDGENALHGGKVGLNRKFWEAEFDVNENILQLFYVSADGDQGFPGSLSVAVTYTLTEENELLINYKATTSAPTVINLTNHTYFNLSAGTEATVALHEITIHAEKYIPVNDAFLPGGELAPVKGTVMDFTSPQKIGKDLFKVKGGFDHTWVLNKIDTDIPQYAASVLHPASGRYMEVLTTQPGVQFYTGNFLDGTLTGKNGVKYVRNGGFCLETQHFPDSPNQPSFPSTILRPGELFNETTVYKFSVKQA